MSKGSEELAGARREEIINACAELYGRMAFREVTLKAVAARTSFTRTLIYYYFRTKEEVFLALLQREYEGWIGDLEALREEAGEMSPARFARALARTLEGRESMLKLLSMNLYDMEANSRMENLVAFKRTYGRSLEAVAACLKKNFPRMTPSGVQRFLYAFFPFLFGVYPYTAATPQQREAMELAQVPLTPCSVSQLIQPVVEALLREFG